MKRIVITVIATLLCSTLISNATISSVTLNVNELKKKDSYTYLVCGLDDAAENTDAIIIFNYNVNDNVASFVQIPRDTYFNFTGRIKKINSIYPSSKAEGADSKTAMQELTTSIEKALAIKFDGYLCFTTAELGRFIDAIGGIDIDLPHDINITDSDGNNNIVYTKGNHHLNGTQAVRFVRFRSGYALGDLGRIDAQKIFLSGFVSKLRESINIKSVAKAALCSEGGFVTNVKIVDALGIALKLRTRIRKCNVKYANLPGVADVLNDGGWYYFVNKKAGAELLQNLNYKTTSSFDNEQRFCNHSNEKTKDYYFNTHTKWRIIDDCDLNAMVVYDRSE